MPPCRILLVEDGVTNRKLISLVLHRAGAKVRCAENGREGVEVAMSESFDLILMDMQMPIMDGYSAARELRRLGCTTPIIALTAHAMAGDERKCREAGCSGYFAKPIDPQRLLAEVARALQAPAPDAGLGNRSVQCEQALTSTLPIEDPEFREIVDEFVVRLETRLTELRAAWNAGELATVAEIAHWIKGSGGTAGFEAFTAPASELEKLAKNGEADRISPSIRRIENLFQAHDQFLRGQPGPRVGQR